MPVNADFDGGLGHRDHLAEPGHALTGRGHHDQAEAPHDPQRHAGSPVPSSNVHILRCVLSTRLGTLGSHEMLSRSQTSLQRPQLL